MQRMFDLVSVQRRDHASDMRASCNLQGLIVRVGVLVIASSGNTNCQLSAGAYANRHCSSFALLELGVLGRGINRIGFSGW